MCCGTSPSLPGTLRGSTQIRQSETPSSLRRAPCTSETPLVVRGLQDGYRERPRPDSGEKVGIQIVPIGSGVEAEMVFHRHCRKPSLGFMDKADVCRILFGGKERDHPERRLSATRT